MEGFCRGCLIKYNEPMELLQYTEKNRRLYVYSTGLQVKRNDTFTFQLCKDCFLNMKQACKFKKLCRTSDKRFRNYFALKDVGDPIDFCTFLKNSDDTLTFRLPMTSGNSTPATQKCRDDDNESTCTSIRNFMTDILQGEEMPDTEARIIREVIEEETDVLDDSLDSHWLQDDMSIDNDFRLDFSFSPFSTPHSVNNDRCYTPKKYADQKDEQVNFDTLNTEKQTKLLEEFTNVFRNQQNIEEINFNEDKLSSKKIKSFKNLKDISTFGIDEIGGIGKTESDDLKNKQNIKQLLIELDIKQIADSQKVNNSSNDESNKSLKDLINNLETDEVDGIGKSETSFQCKTLKELCDFSLDSNDKPGSNITANKSLKELCDISLNSFDDIAKSESNTFKDFGHVKKLCDFGMEVDKSQSNSLDLPSLKSLDKVEINTENIFASNDVIGGIQSNNDMSNSSINIEALLKEKPCPIDKNLEEALKNTENNEFSLDELLISPPVHQASAASTPTITNILFGEKLELTNTSMKPIGQCIEPFDDVQGDIEIFEEFFQNDTKEFDLEDIRRVNREITAEKELDVKVNKENESNNIDMVISIDDKDQIHNNNTTEVTTENQVTKPASGDGFDLENLYCNLCQRKFKTDRALSIHFTKVHNIKIIRPKKKYESKKSRLCSNCGKECRDLTNYTKHRRCGKPVQTFKCERCESEFSSQTNLDKHMSCHNMTKLKKDNGGKEYVCPICGAVMHRHGNYSLHMRRHAKNYAVKCEECGKGFYRPSDLKAHMRQHTGDTPFACKFCPKLFSRRDVLTRHILVHLDERLFQCDNCGLRCIKKYDLIKHIKKKSCIIQQRGRWRKKKVEEPAKTEEVTVIYATGDDTQIRAQLPFLETERSN